MKAVSQESLNILNEALVALPHQGWKYTRDNLTTLRNAIKAELKEQQPDSDFSHYVKKVVAPVPDQSEKDRIFEAAVAYGAGLAANEKLTERNTPGYHVVSAYRFAKELYDKIYKQ